MGKTLKDIRTVDWDGRRRQLILIDQRVLPSRLSYVRCRTHRQVADAIREMVVRGAPAIGVTAAFGMALAALNSRALTRDKLLEDLELAKRELASTRPTAVNLFWALERISKVAETCQGDLDDVRDAVLKEALRMAEEDVKTNMTLGRLGASLIQDGDKVLTHCN
jgi:methylthioribose-1-phosphate isomerase